METNKYLEIDRFPQNDPNAILKFGIPLMHYYDRDVKTIRKMCTKDKALNEKEELQKLLNRYLFKGIKQNNNEYNIVGIYNRFITDRYIIN